MTLTLLSFFEFLSRERWPRYGFHRMGGGRDNRLLLRFGQSVSFLAFTRSCQQFKVYRIGFVLLSLNRV